MADRTGAERACKDPNPIIDGRKANVNLAYLGAKPRINGLQTCEWTLSVRLSCLVLAKTPRLASCVFTLSASSCLCLFLSVLLFVSFSQRLLVCVFSLSRVLLCVKFLISCFLLLLFYLLYVVICFLCWSFVCFSQRPLVCVSLNFVFFMCFSTFYPCLCYLFSFYN